MEKQEFNPQKCKLFIEQQFMKSALPSLVEYVAIDNVSKAFHTPQEWQKQGWDKLQKAAKHIQQWADAQKIKGYKSEIIQNREENLTPILFIEIEGQIDETYFFYGHYDKQPPFEGWNEGLGPYTPVLHPSSDNPQKLYGRGGADDGYASYGSILAIKALIEQGVPIPRCIILIEGDEQSATGDVEKHISNLKKRIGQPKFVFCLDSGAIDYDRLWLTSSLRGFVILTLRVDVISEGVHSGASSGVVPNPFRIARQLIERIEDQENGLVTKELEVDIPPDKYKELYDLAKEKGEEAVRPFPFLEGVQRMSCDVFETLLLNMWKPQVSVVGFDGLPLPSKAGNVTAPFVQLRISIRLPPTKNPDDAKRALIRILSDKPPSGAKITIKDAKGGHGYNNAQYPPVIAKAIDEASQEYFGKQRLSMGEGGSIPLMGFLKGIWPQAHFLITGLLGPASNAHGPNQFMHIPYAKKLICCMAHILAKTAGK